MANEAKIIRGQVRQVVKESLTPEFKETLLKELKAHVDTRLDAIDAYMKSQLAEMNERSQQMQSYLVRNLAPMVRAPETTLEETTAKSPQ